MLVRYSERQSILHRGSSERTGHSGVAMNRRDNIIDLKVGRFLWGSYGFLAGVLLGVLMGWFFAGFVGAFIRVAIVAFVIVPVVLAYLAWRKFVAPLLRPPAERHYVRAGQRHRDAGGRSRSRAGSADAVIAGLSRSPDRQRTGRGYVPDRTPDRIRRRRWRRHSGRDPDHCVSICPPTPRSAPRSWLCFSSPSPEQSHTCARGTSAPRLGLVVGLSGALGAVLGADTSQAIDDRTLAVAAGLALWGLAGLMWVRTRLTGARLATGDPSIASRIRKVEPRGNGSPGSDWARRAEPRRRFSVSAWRRFSSWDS